MPAIPKSAAPPRDLIDRIIDETLRREGWPRYTDHPADRGGPTKGGITLATLTRWRGRPCIARDVEALDEAEVRLIYRTRYVLAPGYGGIKDPQLQALVVDCAVLYGEDDASPWLQQAASDLGAAIKVDGKVGPKTIAAVNALDPGKLRHRICAARLRKMGRVITDKPSQAAFAAGWSNRLAEFVEA
ncbi:glycoside hydrolase family 108 protein [Azospirillum sp.]|uniref:glycoside hydrolase family 108 protein n=1 Tax=Azospirillum sp. TaxID=34012 RepID=UPI002D5E827C|nr:glycosyl hydrolase 108 family protein [Azospirillum sp.]HYF88963.1 glycosyl hydrolase 108 family protein [Azospirillum sp.]